MYFAAGIPRCASTRDEDLLRLGGADPAGASAGFSHPDGATLAIRENWDASFFVSVGVRSMYLWSAKPTVVISKVYRSRDDVLEFGENCDAFWKLDSTVVAVITTAGFLLLYELQVEQGAVVFDLKFRTAHHYNVGPGEHVGLPSVTLAFKTRVQVDNGAICCGTFIEDDLFLATRNEAAIHALQFDGEEVLFETTSLTDVAGAEIANPAVYIQSISYSRDPDAFFAILSDHSAVVLRRETVKLVSGIRAPRPPPPQQQQPPHVRRERSDLDDDDDDEDLESDDEYVDTEDDVSAGSSDDDADDDGDTDTGSVHTSMVWTGRPIGTGQYASMAINPRFSLLALGRMDGTHELHSIHREELLSRPEIVVHAGTPPTLDAQPWTSFISHVADVGSHARRGRISCMTWSWDGLALVLGYQSWGFVVVSTYGNPLVVATKRALHTALVDQDADVVDPYFNGIESAFFGCSCFDLFILPTSAKSDEHGSLIYIVPMLKSAAATNQTPSNFAFPLLVGSDYCMLLAEPTVEVTDGPMRHKYIRYPSQYIAENWPISIAAMDGRGRHIAIGGRRGFVVYSRDTGRWKRFGNHQQEQQFTCRGMVFTGQYLVVVAQLLKQDYAVLVFDINKPLDFEHVVVQQPLQDAPTHLSAHGRSLFVVSGEGELVRLVIDEESQSLEVRDAWTLPGGIDPFNVMAIRRFHSSSGVFVVLVAGTVFVWDPDTGDVAELAEHVEYILSTAQVHADLEGMLWLVSKDQCRIMENGVEATRVPLDFSPLAISPHYGIIVGLSEQLSVRANFDMIGFEPTSKTCLFLHHLLEYLLRTRDMGTVEALANNYCQLGYFNHALEVLLHRVWEREAESGAGTGDGAMLPRVLEFLQQSRDYLDIVVNCVRKTELAMWDYLFSIIGSPQQLFEQCLDSNRLHTATAFLVILHNMESHTMSGNDSIRLLERVLQSEDLELSRDLVRFLRSIGGPGASVKLWNSLQVSRDAAAMFMHRSNSSHASLSAIDQDESLYLEILISRHARNLLRGHRLRSLLAMSRALDFPLVPWLSKERTRGAVIESRAAAIKAVHLQFRVPFPPLDPPPPAAPAGSAHQQPRPPTPRRAAR
ncbi:WD40 repeat protein [Blastocladiella emersonii ATCC 22665]|nr:WD40 repeat protein [Blastocladiella emersonii ATCC 22665]